MQLFIRDRILNYNESFLCHSCMSHCLLLHREDSYLHLLEKNKWLKVVDYD